MAHKKTGNVDVPANIENALAQRGFHVRNKLGGGSFGDVLRAECRHDGNLYAIKILHPPTEKSKLKYYKRELELLIRLRLSELRNVIKYFKSWIIQDGDVRRLCIQMELCWVDLGTFIYDMGGVEMIKSKGPPRFYQHVFPQILNGLSAIHSIQWVHRDIHLGNILIVNPNPQGIDDIHVKIADFGLARYIGMKLKASSRLTIVPKLEKLSPGVGHELFRAPELSTEEYDFKVDVYSSGIVLYLLDCYLPNKDQLRDEILALREEKRKAKHLYHKDDRRLVNLINQLLQKESTRRPTAAEALQYMQRENHESETPSEPKTNKFLVRKRGNFILYRRSSSDTLSSMQDAIQGHRSIGIEKHVQILQQEKTIGNEKLLVGITSDQDVREMFLSAKEQKEKVIVVVSKRNVAKKL